MNLLVWLSNPIGSALGAVGSGLIKVFGKSMLAPILKGMETAKTSSATWRCRSSRPRWRPIMRRRRSRRPLRG